MAWIVRPITVLDVAHPYVALSDVTFDLVDPHEVHTGATMSSDKPLLALRYTALDSPRFMSC